MVNAQREMRKAQTDLNGCTDGEWRRGRGGGWSPILFPYNVPVRSSRETFLEFSNGNGTWLTNDVSMVVRKRENLHNPGLMGVPLL